MADTHRLHLLSVCQFAGLCDFGVQHIQKRGVVDRVERVQKLFCTLVSIKTPCMLGMAYVSHSCRTDP